MRVPSGHDRFKGLIEGILDLYFKEITQNHIAKMCPPDTFWGRFYVIFATCEAFWDLLMASEELFPSKYEDFKV